MRAMRNNIITLTGNNSFGVSLRLNKLINEFKAKHGELGLERIDASEAEAESIIEAVKSLPFLSTGKMIVIRSASANKTIAEKIEQIISSIPPSTDVIFYEPVTDKRTAFYKILKSKTQLEEYGELDKIQLSRWLVDEAKKSGGELSQADAGYLIERVGTNQQILYNELQKLMTYDRKIVREIIDLLTEPTPQSKVFDLLDAAFAGRKTKALELYDDQRAQQVEPQIILGMIAWQLQLLAIIKFSKGKTTAEIAKSAGMNPYPVNKAANMARSMSDEKLREMVDEALNIDIKSKTTSLDLDEALKTYIATI